MSVVSRLLVVVPFTLPLLLAACGHDEADTSCSATELCTSGYVCVDGQCQIDNIGRSGDGDDNNSDSDPGPTDQDGGGDTVTTGDDDGDQDTGADVSVFADTTGPTITPSSPLAGDMVGKVMNVLVAVSDDTGVDESTVAAFFGSQTDTQQRFDIALATNDHQHFFAQFDTTQLSPNFQFPWLGFRAKDTLGNETETGYFVSVDNTPPRIAFSSPLVQARRLDGTGVDCSVPYEPLGDASNGLLVDGTTYTNLNSIPRLRVEDRGNGAGTEPVVVFSAIDDTRAELFFLAQRSGGPILVSASQAGGKCDTINPVVLPTPNTSSDDEAVIYNLVPFTASGEPFFPQGGGSAGAVCTPVGNDASQTFFTGAASAFSHWLTYSSADLPSVYGLEGYDATSSAFDSGGVFDIYNVKEGPVCVAARVYDNAGNVTVTAPIAICVDRGGGLCSGFNAASVRAACGDGCTSDTFGATCGPDSCDPDEFLDKG